MQARTIYTDTNVYWLTWDGLPGRRIQALDGTPGSSPVAQDFYTTFHLEENHLYQSSRPSGSENDRWYWNYIYASGAPAWSNYPFQLYDLSTSIPFSATVRGLLRGYAASPLHHTQVFLNGNLVDDAYWNPEAAYSFEAQVPQSFLLDGPNTVTVKCLLDSGITQDILFTNWFEIGYHRTYQVRDDSLAFTVDQPGEWEISLDGFTGQVLDLLDISSPMTPTRILSATIQFDQGSYQAAFHQAPGPPAGGERRYLAQTIDQRRQPFQISVDTPSDLHSSTNAADYIIITHGDFYTESLPLASYRQSQGLRTAVVDVQDVYDEFSAGLFDPQAIQSFLAYTYAHWTPPAPAYILLIGDGNYDYKNYFGRGEKNYLPPYLADVDLWMGETAADNRYVTVNGNDIFPDMMLGRLPVKTPQETASIVSKILSYEQNPAQDDWNQRMLFITDNADGAGDFPALSDAVADHYIPSNYQVQKIYYLITHFTPATTRAAIIQAINQGASVVNYTGHGSIPFWALRETAQYNRYTFP